MKNRFIENSVSFISKNMDCDEEKTLKLKYGLEGIYLTITKLILITTLAFILGIFKEYLVSLLLFNVIRFTAFGFHANESSTCLIFSSILFVGIPLLFTNFNFSIYSILLLEVISSLILLVYAPADTEKRPLPNSRKRKIRKMATMIIAIIYIILTILFKGFFANMFCIALVIEAIMVNPITYKFFGQTYRNYFNYKSA